MTLLASTVAAVCFMFGFPLAIALLIEPNRRRLERARRYRAVNGTPWWFLESDRAQRQRKWLDRERARVGE